MPAREFSSFLVGYLLFPGLFGVIEGRELQFLARLLRYELYVWCFSIGQLCVVDRVFGCSGWLVGFRLAIHWHGL